MAELLRPDDVSRWVPGKNVLASDQVGWRNATIRAYQYAPSDVFVPRDAGFSLHRLSSGTHNDGSQGQRQNGRANF